MTAGELESPPDSSSLYLARGQDVPDMEHRPVFTGDIFEVGSELVAAVHHPCALRSGGVQLVSQVLMARIGDGNAKAPRRWTGSYRKMFLPDLRVDGLLYPEILFDELRLVASSDLPPSARRGLLSQVGVNLLVQRWVHHNSRVVVPTITINEMISGPFDEADLTGEAVGDLIFKGRGPDESLRLVDAWLGEVGESGEVLRKQLADPQKRSSVRLAIRRKVKDYSPD